MLRTAFQVLDESYLKVDIGRHPPFQRQNLLPENQFFKPFHLYR